MKKLTWKKQLAISLNVQKCLHEVGFIGLDPLFKQRPVLSRFLGHDHRLYVGCPVEDNRTWSFVVNKSWKIPPSFDISGSVSFSSEMKMKLSK